MLVDPQFIFGCNQVIRKTILSYSEQYKDCDITNYPPDQEISLATPEISYILLHDVILMNVRVDSNTWDILLKSFSLGMNFCSIGYKNIENTIIFNIK